MLTPEVKHDLRVMPVDNYLVFYIPDHQAKTVAVLCVAYGGRAEEHRSPFLLHFSTEKAVER